LGELGSHLTQSRLDRGLDPYQVGGAVLPFFWGGEAGPYLRECGQLPQRGTAAMFGPCLLWPNGWVDQDAT